MLRFMPQETGPVLVALFDLLWDVLFPKTLRFLVVIDVELAVNDLPHFRIAVGCVAARDCIRTIAAVLRRIFLRLFCKQPTVGRTAKTSLRSLLFVSEVG